jgi:hypothetical protein
MSDQFLGASALYHPLTKKQRKLFARALIDAQPLYKPFSKRDTEVFAWLVDEDIPDAVKVRNPEYPKDTRHIYVDGESFSWVGRIDEIDPVQKLKRIMRSIIAPDMREFLSDNYACECAFCGATNDLTVDHADLPFDTIASQFIRQHPNITLEKKDNGVGHRFACTNLEAEWIAFHASLAGDYQVLCRSCNASKGKLEDAA